MPELLSCVGCGYCCAKAICRVGAMIYGNYTNPCPALIRSGSRCLCNLYLEDPDRYEHFLAIGEGCCYPDNPLRRNTSGDG